MRKYLYLLFLTLSVSLSAQKVTVTGLVISSKGDALVGATIVEKGTINGTISDFNGNYEFTASSTEATIVVSYTGYPEQEAIIGDQKTINFILENSGVKISEIVVTGFQGIVGKARKRIESIQKVPESVTALNLEGIKKTGVSDISSFSSLVPNMKFNTSQAVGVNFITVRGIPQNRGGDAPVAFVIDGVTVPDPSLLNQELYDLALVEIVKGPQGALYGKNAIGGAINIYTQEPTNSFSNQFKVGYGNGNNLLGQFVSSGPLKRNKLHYRFSTQYKQTDGLLTNDFLDKKVDFRTDLNVRGQLKASINDRLSIKLGYQYFNLDGGATYYSVDPIGNLFDPGTPGGVLDPNPKDGNNTIVSNRLGTSDMINHNGNIVLDYATDNVRFQSISSFNKVDRTTDGDLDFLEFDDFTQYEKTSTTTYNQELRLKNRRTTDKFNWSVGGFFQHVEKPFYQNGLIVINFDPYEQILNEAADAINKTRTIALFGFADYKITSKFTASVGFRFDNDNFQQEDILYATTSERTNNEFQPKVSLSYQISDGALLYTNYGRGYRTGGFNPAATNVFNRDFKDETTDNFELGFKTSSWNNRFILNGSGFYTKFNNQQQFILDLVDFFGGIYNYDESRIIGFDVDSRVRLNKYLDFVAGYGYTHAEIIKGGTTGGADGTTTNNEQYNGNKTPFVPVDNFNVGLESDFPISTNWSLQAFVNLNQTGTTYWHESNLEEHVSDPYYLLDARIAVSYKIWELSLWGRNLLDTQYYQEFSPGQFVGSPDDVAWRGQPMSLGTTIAVKF